MAIATANNTKSCHYSNGKVFFGPKMVIGWNSNWVNSWSMGKMFIDWLDHEELSWGSGGATRDPTSGYFDCSGGGSALYNVFIGADKSRLDDGNWVLEWTGDADVTCPKATYVSGTNPKIYTDIELVSGALTVEVDNGTADPVYFYRQDHQATFNGGSDIRPDLAANTAAGSVMRFMNAMDTNASKVMDYADYTDLGAAYRVAPYLPMAKIAEMCNELNVHPWINIPHMATDACVTAMVTDLYNALDSHLNVYVEYGNEYWNWYLGFTNGYFWNYYQDSPVHVKAIDASTVTVTATSHGLSTGTQIRVFNHPDYSSTVLGNGTQYWVIVDDANTFRLADSAANAASNTPISAIDSSATEIRYKVPAEGSGTSIYQQYPVRAMEVWDLIDAVFGDRCIHVASCLIASTSITNEMFSVSGFSDAVDYLAIAPYFDIHDLPDLANSTPADIKAFVLETELPLVASKIQAQIDAVGHTRFICYEGGDESPVSLVPTDPDEIAAFAAWNQSDEKQEALAEYYKVIAQSSIPLYVHLYLDAIDDFSGHYSSVTYMNSGGVPKG